MSYRDLLQQQPQLLAVGLLAVLSSQLGQSFFFGLFLQPIQQQVQLDSAGFGSFYSAITLCSAFLVMRLGGALDWMSPGRFLGLTLLGLSLGVGLLTLAPWAGLAMLGVALLRFCGQGLLTHWASTLVGRQAGTYRGRALALIGLGFPLAEALLPPLVVMALALISWQQFWWLAWALIAAAWLLVWPCQTLRRPAASVRGSQAAVRLPSPWGDPRFLCLVPLFCLLPACLTGIFIYQGRFNADLGSSSTSYALAMLLLGLVKIPGALFGGAAVDRLGAARVALVFVLPFALGLLLGWQLQGGLGVALILLGGGICMGMQEAMAVSLLVQLWGAEALGYYRARYGALVVFASGLSPALFGSLLDWGWQFQQLLQMMLVVTVIAWLIAALPLWQLMHQSAQQQG